MSFASWLEETWQKTPFPVSLADLNHGDLSTWLSQFEQLPSVKADLLDFDHTISIDCSQRPIQTPQVAETLRSLIPWRKGPFSLFGTFIDSEWRCNLKWDRFGNTINWEDKTVLDIGCGNGYFGYRMLGAGARYVVGLEAHLPYVMQAALLQWFTQVPNTVVPKRFVNYDNRQTFDIVVSMGVLYHQRNAKRHLLDLERACSYGGTLILETLVAEQDFIPEHTYAGMRNVWSISSIDTIQTQLMNLGFREINLLDCSTTSPIEQRKTEWMPYRSLSDSLREDLPTETIEGYPAPKRALFYARKDKAGV